MTYQELEQIRAIVQDALAPVRAELAGIGAIQQGITVLQQDVTALRLEISTHTRRVLDILLQDARMLQAAVNDMARTDVTAREVEAFHHDLNRMQLELARLAARVEALVEGPK